MTTSAGRRLAPARRAPRAPRGSRRCPSRPRRRRRRRAAQLLGDAHQPHAVGVAVADDPHLPGHAAAAGATAAVELGPSRSGTIQVPCWPRTAAADVLGRRDDRGAAAAVDEARAGLDLRAPCCPAGTRPSSRWRRASETVRRAMSRCQRVPKSSATRRPRSPARACRPRVDAASSAEQRSLSITASMPTRRPFARATGMPPPPPAITTTPPVEQAADVVELDDLERLRARDHAPPAAARRRAPTSQPRSSAQAPARRLVVERADRLRRVRERRVVRVDDDAGQHRRGGHVRIAVPPASAAAGSRARPGSSRRARRSGSAGTWSARRIAAAARARPTCGPLPCVRRPRGRLPAARRTARRRDAGVSRLLGPGAALVLAR